MFNKAAFENHSHQFEKYLIEFDKLYADKTSTNSFEKKIQQVILLCLAKATVDKISFEIDESTLKNKDVMLYQKHIPKRIRVILNYFERNKLDDKKIKSFIKIVNVNLDKMLDNSDDTTILSSQVLLGNLKKQFPDYVSENKNESLDSIDYAFYQLEYEAEELKKGEYQEFISCLEDIRRFSSKMLSFFDKYSGISSTVFGKYEFLLRALDLFLSLSKIEMELPPYNDELFLEEVKEYIQEYLEEVKEKNKNCEWYYGKTSNHEVWFSAFLYSICHPLFYRENPIQNQFHLSMYELNEEKIDSYLEKDYEINILSSLNSICELQEGEFKKILNEKFNVIELKAKELLNKDYHSLISSLKELEKISSDISDFLELYSDTFPSSPFGHLEYVKRAHDLFQSMNIHVIQSGIESEEVCQEMTTFVFSYLKKMKNLEKDEPWFFEFLHKIYKPLSSRYEHTKGIVLKVEGRHYIVGTAHEVNYKNLELKSLLSSVDEAYFECVESTNLGGIIQGEDEIIFNYLENAKVFHSLESNEFQGKLLKDLEKKSQNRPIYWQLYFALILHAWARGNFEQLNQFYDLTEKSHRSHYVENRNLSWMKYNELVENFSGKNKTVAIVVGAKHLCGENGLVHLFKKLGLSVEEVLF
ncbi:MAG: hypothetical protein Tsb0021_11490 [Chlamydiales bacterium]